MTGDLLHKVVAGINFLPGCRDIGPDNHFLKVEVIVEGGMLSNGPHDLSNGVSMWQRISQVGKWCKVFLEFFSSQWNLFIFNYPKDVDKQLIKLFLKVFKDSFGGIRYSNLFYRVSKCILGICTHRILPHTNYSPAALDTSKYIHIEVKTKCVRSGVK